MRRPPVLALLVSANLLILGMAFAAFNPVRASETLTGVIAVLYGDHPIDGVTLFTLTTPDGQVRLLDVPPDVLASVGGITGLMGARVTVTTAVDVAASDGASLPVSAVAVESPAGSRNRPVIPEVRDPDVDSPFLTGNQTWLNLLCKFPETAAEPFTQAQVQGLFADTFPNLDHFWRDLAFERTAIAATTSIWRVLPRTRAQYIALGNQETYIRAIFSDCTSAHSASYPFASYTGISIWLNATLDGLYYGNSCLFLTLQGGEQCWRVTWFPYYGRTDYGAYAHEMGHAYGLPHANNFDGDANTYDSAYDLMSAGCQEILQYNCVGMHTNSAYKQRLAYYLPNERFTLTSNGSYPFITLDAVSEWVTIVGAIDVPIDGTRSIAIESRRNDLSSFELSLPASGVVVWHIDNGRMEPAWQFGAVIDRAGQVGLGVFGVGESYRDFVHSFWFTVQQFTEFGHAVNLVRGPMPPSPDLQVSLISVVSEANRVLLTLRARNDGPLASESAFLVISATDTINLNLLALPPGCIDSGPAIACDLGDLAAGASVDRTFDLRPTQADLSDIAAIATSNDHESDMTDNTLGVVIPGVTPMADAAVSLTQLSPQVTPGGAAEYTARLINVGGLMADSATLTVTLSGDATVTGYTLHSPLFHNGSCATPTPSQVACTLQFFHPYNVVREPIALVVQATSSTGQRTATASTTISGAEIALSNNSASLLTLFGTAAQVSGTMTFPGRASGPAMVESVPIAVTHVSTGSPYSLAPIVTTDTSGGFALNSMTAMETFRFRIQPPGALSVVRTALLDAPTTVVSFGTLRMGDADGDNVVTIADFSALAAAFGRAAGTVGYDERADFDNNGVVNVADFAQLSSSFGQAGE